jgi:hypothetical protein
MNTSKPPADDSEKTQEVITAYLDGELEAEEAQAVEDQLSRDASFREDLQSLQKIWDMLDDLPRSEADADFAASTVEMVAVTASDETSPNSHGRLRSVLQTGGIIAGAILTACLVGFLITAGLAAVLRSAGAISDPDDELLRDLPVLVNLDKYMLIEDIGFLRKLNILPRSPQPQPAAPADLDGSLVIDEPIDQRQQRIEAMSPSEKKKLALNQQRFAELDEPHKQRLRQLHRAIAEDEQRDELVQTMDRYYHWYKQLPPQHRLALSGRPADERLAYMQELRAEQKKEQERQRMAHDFRALMGWLDDQATKRADELTRDLPSQRRQEILRGPEPIRRRRLAMHLWQTWHNGVSPQDPPMSEEDLAALKQQISPQTREAMEAQDDVQSAWRTFVESLPEQVRRLPASPGRHPGGPAGKLLEYSGWPRLGGGPPHLGQVSDDRLMRFYQEKVPDEQKERMKQLSRDEFMRTLRHEYGRAAWKNWSGGRAGRPSRRPEGSGRPGGGRPMPRHHRPEDAQHRPPPPKN